MADAAGPGGLRKADTSAFADGANPPALTFLGKGAEERPSFRGGLVADAGNGGNGPLSRPLARREECSVASILSSSGFSARFRPPSKRLRAGKLVSRGLALNRQRSCLFPGECLYFSPGIALHQGLQVLEALDRIPGNHRPGHQPGLGGAADPSRKGPRLR